MAHSLPPTLWITIFIFLWVQTSKVSFGYVSGGSDWPSLDPSFQVCGQKAQSPVAITSLGAVTDDTLTLVLRFNDQELSGIFPTSLVAGNGRISKLHAEYQGRTLIELTSVSFHLHVPAEHSIDGLPADAELHIDYEYDPAPEKARLQKRLDVSKNAELRATVEKRLLEIQDLPKVQATLAVLFSKDSEGDATTSFWDVWTAANKAGGSFNFGEAMKDVIEGSRGFFRYVGSATTPPCTEERIWLILKAKGHLHFPISKDQLKVLKMAYADVFGAKGNARPAQPLNSRKIVWVPFDFDQTADTFSEDILLRI